MKFLYGVLETHGPCSRGDLLCMADPAQRYASEGSHVLKEGLGMGFQIRLTHSREKLDKSVTQNSTGDVLTFDGRLDNYRELAERCGLPAETSSDAMIVHRLFEHWNAACFAMMTGDWALALWSSAQQSIYLARDHAGARPLYYRQNDGVVLWASLLESLLVAKSDPGLSSEYAARYLAQLPLRDLTPYQGTYAVRPGHVLRITHEGISQERHWNALVTQTVRYRNDQEYEEHFLSLFRESVARRSGAGAPILAQLSGGMDSTAIVCMSDAIRRADSPESPLLDTISYFDDSEASLDEKRYFQATEAYRGKSGIHVDMSFSQRTFEVPVTTDRIYPVPGADSFTLMQEKRLEALLEPGGYARILSGVGGDEVLGGVPDPLPELADLIAGRRYKELWGKGVAWALPDRIPLYQLLRKAAKYGADLRGGRRGVTRSIPTWICTSPSVLDESGIELFSRPDRNVPPSCIENAWTWWAILETLPHLTPALLARREYLYPMLDKDLIEFLFAVPREQIVRPGQRRSLMKRALGHLLPPEVLHRRQKAYQLRAPLLALREARAKLRGLFTSPRLAEFGWIDPSLLLRELDRVGTEVSSGHQMILRAVAFELWLRAREERSRQDAMATAPNDWPIASGQYQPLHSV